MGGQVGLSKPRRLRLKRNQPQQDTADEANGKDEAQLCQYYQQRRLRPFWTDHATKSRGENRGHRGHRKFLPSLMSRKGNCDASGFYPPNKRWHQSCLIKARKWTEAPLALLLILGGRPDHRRQHDGEANNHGEQQQHSVNFRKARRAQREGGRSTLRARRVSGFSCRAAGTARHGGPTGSKSRRDNRRQITARLHADRLSRQRVAGTRVHRLALAAITAAAAGEHPTRADRHSLRALFRNAHDGPLHAPDGGK